MKKKKVNNITKGYQARDPRLLTSPIRKGRSKFVRRRKKKCRREGEHQNPLSYRQDCKYLAGVGFLVATL